MSNAAPGSFVAVLGASTNEDRFSFKAVHQLKANGYNPIPVHPAAHTVDGISGVASLAEIEETLDTITMYISAKISDNEYDNIINLKPRRVIFNPGAENKGLAEKLRAAGIEVIEKCTLVMLNAGEY